MSLVTELKRRNVFRVAIAYIVVAWLVMQISDVVLNNISAPGWVFKALLLFLAIGLPFAVIFAWAFEMTPEGIKREREVDRTQSITSQTGRRIDFLIIGVLVIAVGMLLTDKFVLRQQDGSGAADVNAAQTVAVLPFIAMSNGPDDEYFADGLTEEILNSLSHVPALLVTARTSAFAFKGQDISIPEIAAKLGVAHVVEGSVRRAGDQLRITAQLIRAGDGFHLWSDTYDRSGADSFGVQAEIAEKVAAALDIVLDDNQRQKMRSVGLSNPEAFIAFQKGKEQYDLFHGSNNKLELLIEANRWLDRTLALAPEFFDAYVLHTDRYVHTLINASNGRAIPEDELQAAASHINEDFNNAIRYAPDESRRVAASYDLALVTGKWRALTSMFNEVSKLQSCWQPGWLDMSTVAYGMARDYLPLQLLDISCDPLNYSGWYNAVRTYIWLGEYDQAIATATKGVEATAHRLLKQELIAAHIAAGRYEQAETILYSSSMTEQTVFVMRTHIAAAIGDAEKAQAQIDGYLAAGFHDNDELITLYALAGNRALANQYAAEIDARPYGFLALMGIPSNCYCGAPFDLEATPNFGALIHDAKLPWPPQATIPRPLKGW